MRDVVVVAYGRTACCKSRKGSFAGVHPLEYSAQALKGTLAKIPQLKAEMIDDVVMGCAMPVNQMSMNFARLCVNRAGLPDCVPAQTINRFCSGGLQAIATGANAIWAGQMDVVVAGGCEDMTDCFSPYPQEYMDKWIMENYEGGYMTMGETAERVADKWNISREEMDKMALESHTKAAKARKDGKLAPSIVPVTVTKPDGTTVTVTEDEGILADAEGNLKTSMEKMASLKTCFREDGKVTAATSSQTTDAAAFVVLMGADKAAELGIKPIAKFRGFAVAGCDATLMGTGPIYAVPKCLDKCGMTIDQMDVIELNEAFASQAIACMRDLKMDASKVNPYGGAMALGHPMGATGAFLTCKALDYLQDPATKGKYAMVTMCIGGGMGACGIYEMCD